MKKWLIVLIMGCALVGIAAKGCPFKGEDGDDGASGSSGQDAVLATYSYQFSCTGVGNPYAKDIPTISLADVESGKQTVTVYVDWAAGWLELPFSEQLGATLFEYNVRVYDGYVQLSSFSDGVLYVGDACLGEDCMIIVKVFNK